MTIHILGYATHVTDSVFRELLEYGALEFLQVYFYLFIHISVIFVRVSSPEEVTPDHSPDGCDRYMDARNLIG